MKWPIVFVGMLVCLSGSGQEIPDVSGRWQGNSNFLGVKYHVTTTISQDGNSLKASSVSVKYSGKDSTKVLFEGTIDGDKVLLRPVKFVYKTNAGDCLSSSELTWSRKGNQLSLLGRWKGGLSFKTCPPGVGGGLNLYRTVPEPLTAKREVQNREQVYIADDVGTALINELGRRKYYALIIGVDDYPDETIPGLDQPVADGKVLSKVLRDNYTFESAHMRVLQNPTRSEIIEALDTLSMSVTEKDNLLIFYAGHGVWNEQLRQGYWLPSDASMSSKSNWISNSTIRDYVGGINSKHTLLISDACFSGGILKERAVFENSRAVLELYKLPSRKAMTSGTLKTVPDKSVFIEYLVKNLKNSTAPLLSADQLFRTFKIAVINNSPNGQVPQYGPITQAGDEGGDFIFLRRK